MNPFSNSFEKEMDFYFFIYVCVNNVAISLYYATEYIPSFFRTPLFIFGWIFHGLVVIILIFLWWQSCKKDQSIKEFDDEE